MRSLLSKLALLITLLVYLLLTGCNMLMPTRSGYGNIQLPAPKPTQIALLLPLQGPLGTNGQAVRNGFLAAYYYDKQQGNSPNINVIDTSSGNIISQYQQAVSQGANFIVGPLTKENVQAIAKMGRLPVTTLALNTLDYQRTNTDNLIQFGLSPLDEAAQAAEKAYADGHRNVLIITPAGAWGQGITQAFIQNWENLGGTVVGNYFYSDPKDFSAGIKNLLQVTETKPVNPTPATGNKPIPEHRQDADVIFLAAFPQQARQIRPILLFYNAGDIPVYATSLIYSGLPSIQYDRDLNGIDFCDMPWILNPNESGRLADIRNQINTIWGNSFTQSPRLYALGVDAYMLTTQLGTLVNGGTVTGATGILRLNQYNHIVRQLSWAQIKDGVPVMTK